MEQEETKTTAATGVEMPPCKDGRNHRKGSIYHCGSESRTGCKRWLGTLEEWRRLD